MTDEELHDLLLPHIRKFVACCDGGRWSFRLLCGNPSCRQEGSISAKKHTIGKEANRVKACKKFILQGWKYERFPICPECYKKAKSHIVPLVP